jgi:hypothetical protein
MSKDLERALIGKTQQLQGDVGEALSNHSNPDKAQYFG